MNIMKLFLMCLVMMVIAANCKAQAPIAQNLYEKVDSIVTYQLLYKVDATTDMIPTYEWDSKSQRGLYTSEVI